LFWNIIKSAKSVTTLSSNPAKKYKPQENNRVVTNFQKKLN